jgi:hypothetical protein
MLWLVVKQGGAPVPHKLGGVRFVPLVSPVLDDPQGRIELHDPAN